MSGGTDVDGEAVEVFRRVQAEHARCVWLDPGGPGAGTGTLAWCEPDDVSLTYDATSREVTRHAGGTAVVVGDDPFAVLASELAAGHREDRWFGYLGYAARADLPAATDPDLPDAVWMRPSRFADLGVSVPRVGTSGDLGGRKLTTRGTETPNSRYREAFAAVQEQLHAGNSYEVNLTYRERVRSPLAPAAAYLRLRELNPAPYGGFLQHDVPGARAWLLSSSPEQYAAVDADRVLQARPIKGTTARGATPAADAAAREHLAYDAKYRAENLMIVDLLRNDLSAVCEVGSVQVPELMAVESYPSVHQLVSTVRGRLRPEVDTVAALRALFPAGSMTGAPKLRTMQVIGAVEDTPRGVYSGAFGWIAADGRADLGVVIRSLATAGPAAALDLESDGGTEYVLGTGGGITVASDVAAEHAETRWKVERLLAALTP
ncbi:anthranilate synthase component I family protein [Nocardioides faecalis]|uniref:anthranilate synthase component I family protein n=1 Tax=Nocardioides faecalis TaxID=2803858 RepID=UPI0020BFE28F|nr:anthranilate synthase component I family protein [Nocardioides faecalis]